MKLQLASDLHLERLAARDPSTRIIAPASGADLLVLAGDIHNGAAAVSAFADWPVPVIYVAGNHEFYGRSWEGTRAELKRVSAGSNIHFLDDDAVAFDGVRFLGCTLWTDFALAGCSRDEWMASIDRSMNDHLVQTRRGPLRSRQMLDDHERSRRWLERELAQPFDGRTVVVSHHGPHPGSIHPRHAESRLNAGFVSDLSALLAQADLWLHGHVHDSFDYAVAGCRVVSNPVGYMLSARTEEPVFENPAFDPQLVLDTASGTAGATQ